MIGERDGAGSKKSHRCKCYAIWPGPEPELLVVMLAAAGAWRGDVGVQACRGAGEHVASGEAIPKWIAT